MFRPRLRLLIALGMVGGCRPADQRTDSVDVEAVRAALDFDVAARLDRGNAAYRAGDFGGAVRHYEEVVTLAPQRPEGWFGLYIAERARGNVSAAEAALDRARDLAPGASLLRPSGDTGR